MNDWQRTCWGGKIRIWSGEGCDRMKQGAGEGCDRMNQGLVKVALDMLRRRRFSAYLWNENGDVAKVDAVISRLEQVARCNREETLKSKCVFVQLDV